MKPWELKRRTKILSEKLRAFPCEGIRVDFDSFPEQEKLLILKVSEMREEDFSRGLPKEVLDENRKLLSKFLRS